MMIKEKNAALQKGLVKIVRAASATIMPYYQSDMDVERKDDNSPVTIADKAAHEVIMERLAELDATIPIISEELDSHPEVQGERFWLVDPLDGTKSFIRGEGEFTVNIALIEHGIPTVGVIDIPAQDICYYGVVGQGAWKSEQGGTWQPIQVRDVPGDAMAIVASKSHLSDKTKAWMTAIPMHKTVQAASSLKFCVVAEGGADLYPRLGTTMEWDTAAGHAILTAAGGHVTTESGEQFTYGKADYRNGWFIARGALEWDVIQAASAAIKD